MKLNPKIMITNSEKKVIRTFNQDMPVSSINYGNSILHVTNRSKKTKTYHNCLT